MRALVIKLSSLGDLFHALPTVAQLHDAWGTKLDWVTNHAYVELVQQFDPVDQVIGFPRQHMLRDGSSFLRELRLKDYDVVLDMQGLLKSALTAKAARSVNIVGPSFHREGASFFYSSIAGRRNKNRHAVDENMDMLTFFDVAQAKPSFPVTFSPPAALPEGLRVGLLPCSRWKTKNWPPEHFITVAKELREKCSVYLFGAPDDRAVCAEIADASGATNLCAQTSLVELGGWLSAMDLVITVDSGPMHMAAATGTPVLAVFGSTDPRRTGPYGAQHRVIYRDELPCRPCLSRTCKLKDRDIRCLDKLSPSRVLASVRDMLDQASLAE